MVNVPIYLVVSSPAECVGYYLVEYKMESETGYTSAGNQTELPIMLYNLQEDTIYNVRITAFCCNGQFSTTLEFNVSTSALEAPANFNVVQDGSDVDGTWDAVAGADNYIGERAEDSGFTVNLIEVYSGAINSFTDLSVAAGTWYYRVKAQMSGAPDSDWSTDSVIVT